MRVSAKRFSLYTILLMFFIDYMGIGLVFPILSSMFFSPDSHFLNVHTSQVTRGFWLGIILALMPLAQFFSAPILGTLSDRIGRKTLMLTSITFGALGYAVALMSVWHENLFLMALSRIIVGIAAGNEAVGSAAIADVSTSEDKVKNFGLMHMAAGFGFTGGPFLGGKLSTMSLGIFSGYAAPFIFAGVFSLINMISVAFLFKETHVAKRTQRAIAFGFKNIKKAWSIPGFSLLFLAIFFYNFGWEFYWQFIPVYWIVTYKLDLETVSYLCAWGAVIYATSAGIFVRPIITRFNPEKVLFYALILAGFSLALPLLFTAAWMFWFLLPIQEYLIALVFPETSAIVSNKTPEDVQGEMMGILQSVQSLALILGPLVAGTLLGLTVKMPLIVGACSFLIAAVVLKFYLNGVTQN